MKGFSPEGKGPQLWPPIVRLIICIAQTEEMSFPQDQKYWAGGDFIYLGQGQPAGCPRQCAWQNPACDLI